MVGTALPYNNLEKKFASTLIMRPMINSEKIFAEDQQEYWSVVGMLLCLVKQSCPNFANIMRELSTTMMVQTLLHTRTPTCD